MRVGIAHHFGWAVAVTADASHRVVDRRRIELVEPGTPVAPVHTDGAHLDDDALVAMIESVRASAVAASGRALDDIASTVDTPIVSLSLRAWDPEFPTDIETVRRVPYEARADSVMYRQVLADLATDRGWKVHLFDAKTVEAQARALLGSAADDVLVAPRAVLGPPWNKDHRIALAATVLAAR